MFTELYTNEKMNNQELYNNAKSTVINHLMNGDKPIVLYGTGGNGKTFLINELSELISEKKYNIIPEVHEKIENLNNSDLIVSLNLSDFVNIDKDSYNLVDMSSIRF